MKTNTHPQSNYFGYPNLAHPYDHWNITPFEAIFVGDQIQPHIRLKDASPQYVDSLNSFILNEVELSLRNEKFLRKIDYVTKI